MKESNLKKDIKKKHSWNFNSQKIRKSFNRRSISKNDKTRILKNNLIQAQNDDKFFLSNANINILNIINTCMSDDLKNDCSFINMQNNKSKDNSNKPKKSTSKSLKSKDFESIKNKTTKKTANSNKAQRSSNICKSKKSNIFKLTGSDSFNNSKQLNYMRLFNENEVMFEGKLLSRRDKKSEKYYSNLSGRGLNITTYNKKTDSSQRFRSHSNKRIKKMKFEQFLSNSKKNSSNSRIEKSSTIFGHLSEIELFKINENINKEINYINLKKKITKLKKKIELKISNNSLKKYKIDKENNNQTSNRNSIRENNKENDSSCKSNLIKKITPKKITSSEIKEKEKIQEKYRFLIKKKCLYDSIDDEEYDDELIDYYISPNSLYTIIFDIFIFISSMFYFIFVPYFLSINFFFFEGDGVYKYIFFVIDVLYIIDIVINFFRAYQTYDEHLIRKTKRIIIHYIKTWFLIDLIQAIPYYSIFHLLKKIKTPNEQFDQIIYILLIIKIIKVYKLFIGNSTLIYLSELITKNEVIDEHGGMILTIVITFLCLNLATCLFIFLGINSYSNWIIKLNIQDEPFLKIYLISLYFIIVTITTVGYGDITGNSISEIIFQIILLIVGTISYSFIISYISNYIIKSNKKSMTYEKNLEILQEIKLSHPNMKESIYREVLRTLYNEQLYERKDKHLLFDSLSYSIKNELIIEMYKPLIMNFIFFKDIYNSDFFIKVATSLKSLISVKGNILIQEGDFVKEIFFIKSGVVGLNISIDLNNPENSIKKFFYENEIGKFDISYLTTAIISKRKNTQISFKSNINSFLANKVEDSDSNDENDNNIKNIADIKILEIRKNEHFGDALMFLNERSPLIAKVRTRTAELLILRKMEAIEIYSVYPNIWKKINKKSLYNMEQIYQKIKRVIIDFSIRYNIKIQQNLNESNISGKLIKDNRQKKVKFSIDIKKNKNIKEKNKNEENQNNNENIDNESINADEKISKSLKVYKDINSNKNTQQLITDRQGRKNKEKGSNNSLNFKKIQEIINDKDLDENLKKSKTKNVSTISVVQTNSFIIFHDSEKKNKTNLIGDNNKKISIQKNSFNIQGRSLTIKNDSKDSIKVNESINSKSLNDLNNSVRIKNTFNKTSLLQKKEDIYYNTFIGLNLVNEKTLQLNSCYDNIHKLSNYRYIDDIILQYKVKQFIIKECIEDSQAQENNIIPNLAKSQKMPKNKNNDFKQYNTIKNDEDPKLFRLESFKYSRSLRKFLTKKTKGDKNEKTKRSISLSSNENNNNNIYNKKISRFNSIRNNGRDRFNVNSSNKIKRKYTKKKLIKVNQKLVAIRKNIQNTNNAINNPMKFYMNFFHDIIKNKSSDNDNKEEEIKKNL